MKKWAAALAAAAVLAAGVAVVKRRGAREEPGRMVAFPAVRRALVETIRASGTVEPKNLVPVRVPIHGRIEELRSEVGDRVTKGTILATMSSADRAAILDESLSRGTTTYDKWKEFYRPTPVVAPVAGRIIHRGVVKGEAVRPGEEVYTIADELVVTARADETDVTSIRAGQPALLRFDAYPDKTFRAKVLSVGLQAERVEGVSVYEVVLRPSEKPEGLKTGMNVETAFILSEKPRALVVPSAAVGGRRGVKIRALCAKSPKDKPEWRVVELGASDGRLVEIVSGLEDGEAMLVPEAVLGGARPAEK